MTLAIESLIITIIKIPIRVPGCSLIKRPTNRKYNCNLYQVSYY
jgi:hypothetical protein